jgi:hypothetical protein
MKFQLQVAIATSWQDLKIWWYKKQKGPNPQIIKKLVKARKIVNIG